MKTSVLFRRFICGIAALLVSGGATAEGVRLSEWRDNTPLRDFSTGQSLSQTVVTNNQEAGLFQRGFVGEDIVAALLNPAVLVAIVAVGAVAVVVSNDDDEAVLPVTDGDDGDLIDIDALIDMDMSEPDEDIEDAPGDDGDLIDIDALIDMDMSEPDEDIEDAPDGENSNMDGVSMAVMCGPNNDMPANRVFTDETGTFLFVGSNMPVTLTSSIMSWFMKSGDSSIHQNIRGPAPALSRYTAIQNSGLRLPIGSDGRPLSKGTSIRLYSMIGVLDSPDTPAYALYTYDDSAGVLFAAAGGLEAGRKCTLEAGEFFLTADNVRTTEYATTNQFRERLRGVLSEGTVVRLGDFYFAGDEKFSNIKLERRDDLWLSEEFDVYSALGYQKIADDNTAVFYNQLTALRHLSADTDGYLQISSGSVTSAKYRDGQLRGLAVGFITDKVLSHDNILHFRLERPTGDARAKSWYAAADVQMGNAAKYWSFSLRHNLDTAQIEGGIYYQREF